METRLNIWLSEPFFEQLGPDWQIDNGLLLTGKSWLVLKSWYTDGDLEQGFWRRTSPNFNFLCGAGYPNGELTCRLINSLVTLLFQMLAYSVEVEFERTSQVLKEKEYFFVV